MKKRTSKKVLQAKTEEIAEIKRLLKNIKTRYNNVKNLSKQSGFINPFVEKVKKLGGLSKLNYVGKGSTAIDNTLKNLQQLDTYKTGRVSTLKNTIKGREKAKTRMKDLEIKYGKKMSKTMFEKIDTIYARVMEEHPMLEAKSEISSFVKEQIKIGLEKGYNFDTIMERIDNFIIELSENQNLSQIKWDKIDDIEW